MDRENRDAPDLFDTDDEPRTLYQAGLIIGALKAKLRSLNDENEQLWSVIALRGILEAVDGKVRLTYNIPVKDAMIERLQRDGHQLATLVTIQNDFNVSEETFVHLIRWIYFLRYCPNDLCNQIRRLLQEKDVKICTFSALVARIYECTSSRVHKSLEPLFPRLLKEGFKLHGIDDQRFFACIPVLNELQPIIANTPSSVLSTSTPTVISTYVPAMPQTPAQSPTHTIFRSVYAQHTHPRTFRRPYVRRRGRNY